MDLLNFFFDGDMLFLISFGLKIIDIADFLYRTKSYIKIMIFDIFVEFD